MKSFIVTGTGISSIRPDTAIAPPQPGYGQVLVRIGAASLNFRDLLVAKGLYGPCKSNLIPLSDGAGEIVAVGDGVTRVRNGDRVALTFHLDWVGGAFGSSIKSAGRGAGNADGVLSECVCVSQDEVVHIPPHLTFEQAATLPCAAVTAWTALTAYASLMPGDTVLVQGTGGVSIFALQFAKLFGARVIVTSSSDEKLERMRALGADDLINYNQTTDWGSRAVELTNGIGVDVVVEVGGANTFSQSIKATRVGGRISVVGLLSGMPKLGPEFFLKMQSIHSIRVGSREHFERMNQAIISHRLEPIVDRVFDFDEAINAYLYFEDRSNFGKVVIRME